MTRHTYLLCLLFVALALPACGDDDVAGARMRVLTSEADGPLEGDLQFQSLEDGEGRVYETKALGDGLFVAPGAPQGKYRVFTTAGWGMLWSGRQGSAAPLLRGSEYPALTVRMGKPRSLYVASGMPGRWTLSGTWGADWKRAADGDKAEFQPVDLKIEKQDEGIFALRFPADVWATGNVLRFLGLTTDGTVTAMQSYQLSDHAHVLLPRMALMLAATQASLTVHLVPPPGVDQVPDGTPVRVSLEGVALAHTYEAQSYRGRARFDELAALGHDLRVELPQSGPQALFRIDPGTWRMRGAMHIVAVDPQALARVRVHGRYTEARVCYRGGTQFGRVGFEHVSDPEGIWLRTHPGWQEWWLKTEGGEWVHVALDVAPPPATTIQDAADRSGLHGVRVRGTARARQRGSRVEFRRVHEALVYKGSEVQLPERKLGGEGLEATISLQGGYEAHLPPGRYEIRVLGPGGSGGRPTTLSFQPGSEVRFDPPPR